MPPLSPTTSNNANFAQNTTPRKAKQDKPVRVKIVRRKISGVFLLNKPAGISSNAALQKVKWLFRAEKAGHTGALDPIATGLLPICLGEATKFSHYLLDANKTYQTTIVLGATTTTGDTEGEISQRFDIPPLTAQIIEQTITQFLGVQQQIPPMYSALKKDGQPLYKLAREGIEIERAAREITIDDIQLLDFTQNTISLQVSCSKGTYIRVLAEDFAKALGTGGYVSLLHRIKTGNYELLPHYTIDFLEGLTEAQRDALLLPSYASISDFERIDLDNGEDFYFCRGQSVMVGEPAGTYMAFAKGVFLGLGEVDDYRQFQPKRLVNN